jgi:hypothetical protein
MKTNYLKISAFLLGALYVIVMIYLLYGCSANYHFGKFLDKGGKIDTTQHIVEVSKMIKVNGKDSIITVVMPFNCPEVQIPATRQEIRYKYRIQRDSIETVRYITKWKTKLVKIEKKAEKVSVWNWFFGGLCLGIWIAVLVAYLIRRK